MCVCLRGARLRFLQIFQPPLSTLLKWEIKDWRTLDVISLRRSGIINLGVVSSCSMCGSKKRCIRCSCPWLSAAKRSAIQSMANSSIWFLLIKEWFKSRRPQWISCSNEIFDKPWQLVIKLFRWRVEISPSKISCICLPRISARSSIKHLSIPCICSNCVF